MKVLFILHDHLTPPGAVGEQFVERGYEIVEHVVVPEDRFATPGVTTQFPELDDIDAVVPLGAPWASYDDDLVGSWVRPEVELLREAHEREIPVLGICFGGQLLALAHGGSVAQAPEAEIGWYDVESDDVELVASGPWFEWHYDRWALPPGATEVARTGRASQAFVIGRNLALQFHPELDSSALASWLRNGGEAVLAERGVDRAAVVAQTQGRDEAGRAQAHRLVNAFLDRVARP